MTTEQAKFYGDYVGAADGTGLCSHCETTWDNRPIEEAVYRMDGCQHENAVLCGLCSEDVDNELHDYSDYWN